ncbi:MAG: methyltransferase domain-containing protein [Deltaproteobacteria bacterium]|nr:methyltransferase domain-containing protein [Deltaproteobacteria bacterium]
MVAMTPLDVVSEFYGKTVEKSQDLTFSACCTTDYDPKLLAALTDEVKDKRYGCGSPLPDLLAGCTVVDLGSGAGADCFIAAQLVGQRGRVIGVDATREQLEVARRNVAPIMKNLGYVEPNVSFLEAPIEELPIASGSADVVISNCVINLSPHKERVFKEIARILKPGGELYLADIVADRRIPEHLASDRRLYSECLTGAAYTGDLSRIMARAGLFDVRTVSSRSLDEVIEGIHFSSVTLRGFKLDLEDACEDYGQVAVYRGTIPARAKEFLLDTGHRFEAGRAVRVCKNTADMLTKTRYSAHFGVSAEMFHMGLFDCGPAEASSEPDVGACGPGCC